ncbi:MAG: N-acetylmuramoyl-L-alanine amidase [Candidatus Tumulicola sp.]
MSWTSRSTAPIFRALLCSGLVAAFALPAAADAPIKALYLQQPIVFTHVSGTGATTAVGVNDPGLRALLHATGAAITWRPGERYVLMTTAAPAVVSFAVGDRRYDVGPVVLQASIAPFVSGNEAYLPFNELLRSLDLAIRPDGATWILQPQLASLDVRSWGNRADIVVRGGIPLRPRIVQDAPGAVIYEFDGLGTALTGTRNVNAGGIRSIAVSQSGPARDPKTVVNVQLLPGASHDVPRSDDGRDLVVSFGPAGWTSQVPFGQTPPPGAAANGEQPQTPSVNASGAPASGAAAVTSVTVAPSSDGYAVTIAVSGNAAFEWHRLRDPDNRFWVDVKNAQLQTAPIDQTEPDPLGALRVRQIDPTTVRIALSLTGPKALAVSPATTGLSVDIGSNDVADAPRAGSGSVGTTVASSEQTAPVTPAPGSESASSWNDAGNGWKFGSRSSYVAANPRLIVIDPGHGGSDRGSSRHGVDEAGLALDMSKRLRDILVARGWQVRMTHDTDVDVYQPNDSAHDELQARVDVANHAGARMFVSIHANAYINSGPYGTTYYISKPGDLALAQAIERDLSSDGTKDDGIVRAHLYVTLHSLMPAVLIETAFISNPNDFALLNSSAWRQRVAQSIADGIDRYAAQYPASNQPAQ